MQPTTITLTVDAVDKVWTRFSPNGNRTVYRSEDHSILSKDTLTLYRTEAKPTGNFNGTAKGALKFSREFEVNTPIGTTKAPLIIEMSYAVPVGVPETDVNKLVDTLSALLLKDTIVKDLVWAQDI